MSSHDIDVLMRGSDAAARGGQEFMKLRVGKLLRTAAACVACPLAVMCAVAFAAHGASESASTNDDGGHAATFRMLATSKPVSYEPADVPSQRTLPWSVHNRKELNVWRTCHESMSTAAASYSAAADAQHRRLVLFGDSITESWRGTSYCKPMPRTRGVPAALNSTLAARWPAPVVLGISADCTQHLLWRMQHGELTPAMGSDPWLTFVLLIGTNNLGHGHSVEETTRGVVAVANHLLNATHGRLLVNALLPRGDRRKRKHAPKPPKGGSAPSSPPSSFKDDVLAVNAALKLAVANELEASYRGRARFVDCGAPFYTPPPASVTSSAADLGLVASAAGATTPHAAVPPPTPLGRLEVVRRELMPDRLHPNAAGQALWGSCLVSALERWGGR